MTRAWTYRVCSHCAQLKPCEPDGLMGIHYLRRKQADRDRRERCPGSRLAPSIPEGLNHERT